MNIIGSMTSKELPLSINLAKEASICLVKQFNLRVFMRYDLNIPRLTHIKVEKLQKAQYVICRMLYVWLPRPPWIFMAYHSGRQHQG